MLRNVWMRPALQTSEAVMMPALQRPRIGEPVYSDRYYRKPTPESAFVPVPSGEMTTALSTYVRPRGSLAGRSVLRAVGMGRDGQRGKPRYHQRWPRYAARPHKT